MEKAKNFTWKQLLVAILLIGAILVGLRFYVESKIVGINRDCRDLVQAICNYRAEKGMLPDALEDLGPEHFDGRQPPDRYRYYKGPYKTYYLPYGPVTYPLHGNPTFDGKPQLWMSYRHELNIQLAYLFDLYSHTADVGWSRDLITATTDFPPVSPTVPILEGDELIESRLQEFDRRIRNHDVEGLEHQAIKKWYETEQAKYLKSLGREPEPTATDGQ